MHNMNSGYTGYSMSNRAVEAYENGEKPKSKWTKADMIETIKTKCEDSNRIYDEQILKKISKNDLFDMFFCKSSWHHTSKMCNATIFYSPDPDLIHAFFPKQTETDPVILQTFQERKETILNQAPKKKAVPSTKEPPKQTWWVLGSSVWTGKRHPKITGYSVEIKEKITERQRTAAKYCRYNGEIREFDTYEEAQTFARQLEEQHK